MTRMRPHYSLVTCLLFLAGCNADYIDYAAAAERRIEYARINQGDIVISAIQDSSQSNYIKGVALAVEEINRRKGGLLGRKLKLNIEPGSIDFESTLPTIRRIVADPAVSVVLSQGSSTVAIPASIIYEKSKTLFMPSFSTAEGLTSHRFEYVFRMLPDNGFMTEQISGVAETLGYGKIAILYARDDYSRELAFLFEESAISRQLELVFRASFFARDIDFRPIISDLRDQQFDAIFISAGARAAATLVRQLREMDIDAPILGADSLNSKEYKSSVGIAGNGTIVPTLYNMRSDDTLNRNFTSRYRDKHQIPPDADAAQGYDSVLLFANSVIRAKSTLPALLRTTLHFTPPWIGVTGIHRYDKKGHIQGKKYFFQTLNNEKWRMLPTIRQPSFLQQPEHHLKSKKTHVTTDDNSFLMTL